MHQPADSLNYRSNFPSPTSENLLGAPARADSLVEICSQVCSIVDLLFVHVIIPALFSRVHHCLLHMHGFICTTSSAVSTRALVK